MGNQRDERPRDHYVSAGWQKNFADLVEKKNGVEGFVSQFSVETGQIVESRRNVNRSLYGRDYGTFWNEDGTENRSIDELFTATEDQVIKPLRRIDRDRVSEEDRERIIQLFALHHARSTAMRLRLSQMVDDVMAVASERLMADPKIEKYGIPRELVEDQVQIFHEREITSKRTEAGEAAKIRDDAVKFLRRYHVQIVESPVSFPGFVLGDVPVVNANLAEQRFGIRDDVKLNESDFIGGPLTRHQAVVFSREPAPHFIITNPELIATFNVQTPFAATELVVCHPKDAEPLKFLWENRELYRTTAPLIH